MSANKIATVARRPTAQLVDVRLHPPVVLHLNGDLRRRPRLLETLGELFPPGVHAPHRLRRVLLGCSFKAG